LGHWNFLVSTYKGGRKWFKENIFQYIKEGDTEYKQRVDRAYRFNHTREVVDLVNKYLFRGHIDRIEKDAPAEVVEFWGNATYKGLHIDELMWTAGIRSSITGRCWIVVDSTHKKTEGETGQDITSKADEAGSRIYSYLVWPQQVLDMSYDDEGELNWILIEEATRDDEDPYGDDNGVVSRYRLWTRESWTLIQEVYSSRGTNKTLKAKVIGQGTHGLGLVPVVSVDNMLTTDLWDCPAMITDIAYLDRATANYASNLDAIIQDQTFSQLAMPAQNLMPGEDSYDKLLEMGTKRIFLYDGEGGKGPEFISPDPRQASLIVSAIQTLINEIYHSVGLAGERIKQDNSKGTDNSSGVAKAADFERVTALLRSKAESLESSESRLVKVVCAWAGVSPPDEELVKYPETFDVRDLFADLYIAMQLSLMDAPTSMKGKHFDAVIEKLFYGLSKDERKVLQADIDKWEKDQEEVKDIEKKGAEAAQNARNQLLGEGKRDREASGEIQSKTKQMESNISS